MLLAGDESPGQLGRTAPLRPGPRPGYHLPRHGPRPQEHDALPPQPQGETSLTQPRLNVLNNVNNEDDLLQVSQHDSYIYINC